MQQNTSRIQTTSCIQQSGVKKAMEPYLPSRIIHRPKTGFGVPLRSWLKNELLEVVEETLSEQNLKRRDVFSAPSWKPN